MGGVITPTSLTQTHFTPGSDMHLRVVNLEQEGGWDGALHLVLVMWKACQVAYMGLVKPSSPTQTHLTPASDMHLEVGNLEIGVVNLSLRSASSNFTISAHEVLQPRRSAHSMMDLWLVSLCNRDKTLHTRGCISRDMQPLIELSTSLNNSDERKKKCPWADKKMHVTLNSKRRNISIDLHTLQAVTVLHLFPDDIEH